MFKSQILVSGLSLLVLGCSPGVRDAPSAQTDEMRSRASAASSGISSLETSRVEPTAQALPRDESEFISTIGTFRRRYQEAPNEFQKSTARRERAAAIAGVLHTLSIKNWI